jgi:3-oxoacyl-[acyl-carrier protein] reductase
MSTALVIGGSRGIGLASARALARDGFDILLTYTSDEAAVREAEAAIAAASQGKVGSLRIDVRDPAAIASAFDAAETLGGGKVECVVVNAGINRPPSPVHDSDPAIFRELVDINLIGAYNALREAGRRVADGGTIIALSTSLVRQALPGIGLYVAVKAGVEALVKSMARELSSRNVRVNAVAPGPVDTDLFHSGKTDEAKAKSAAMSPLNRIGRPEEIAEVVSFIASPRASWVHGQIVQPNGGLV